MRRVEVVAGILEEQGRYLLGRRTEDQSFPLQWEFPGGKIEPGESPDAALEREFLEEVGIQVRTGELFASITYARDAEIEIRVRFYRVTDRVGEPKPLEVHSVAWIERNKLSSVDFIRFNGEIVAKLIAEAG